MPSRPFSRVVGVLVAALLAAAGTALATPAQAATPVPRTPTGLPAAIEPLAAYVPQDSCDSRTQSGTLKLARLLAATYRSTTWATSYACGTDGSTSEHYEGRAIDWMVDIHKRTQYAAARAVLSWLLGTDRAGNRFAMARRLGVMYVIYDNRMWGAWDGRWEDYNGCAHLPSRADDNACHRTHLHISLGWAGAEGRTSFWTKRVAGTDYGPCRTSGLNWAAPYVRANPRSCPPAATLRPARNASATKVALVRYSGVALRRGWSGPAVAAVQRALHVTADGDDGPATTAAVVAFQRRAGLPANGTMTPATWRALLARTR